MSETSPKRTARRPVPAPFWVSSTYFAEGFPYTLVNNVVEIMFEQLGASLRLIGMTSLFHLPWNLKFLWGPFVDQYETKRRWLLWVEVALSVVMVALSFQVGTTEGLSLAIGIGFFILGFLSATHDIAIDGFYLEGLDEKEQSAFVGWRATFYRIAGILLGGPLLWLIGRAGWFVGLLVISMIMIALTVYHFWVLPRVEERKEPIRLLVTRLLQPRIFLMAAALAAVVLLERKLGFFAGSFAKVAGFVRRVPVVGDFGIADWSVTLLLVLLLIAALVKRLRAQYAASSEGKSTTNSAYAEAFSSFLEQPRAVLILAFVVLFRTGESFLMKMRWPFLHQNVGMPLEDYAIYNGTVGVVASFSATLLGGWLISRRGLLACIWPFVLAQNVLNLLYMAVGLVQQPQELSTSTLAAVIALEHAGAGLGTAVFMVFLMRCCHPDHKAAHMAILTALMSISFTIAGVASGFLAQKLGFAFYFGVTFLATIPSMLMIPWLPYLDGRRQSGS